MREFFMGWRRKAGLISLGVTCLGMTAILWDISFNVPSNVVAGRAVIVFLWTVFAADLLLCNPRSAKKPEPSPATDPDHA